MKPYTNLKTVYIYIYILNNEKKYHDPDNKDNEYYEFTLAIMKKYI